MIFKFILVIRTLVNFNTAFLDKLGIIKGMIIYRIRRNNSYFIARSGTEDMAEIVVVSSGYEYDLNLIKLPQESIVVDLGGHIGTFSVFIDKALRGKVKIYTFEPDVDNYRLLRANLLLNNVVSVKAKNIAISDYSGMGYLRKEKMNTDAYYLDPKKHNTINCEVEKLSQALRGYKLKKIDLLKMDIEGGEYSIFQDKASLEYILKNVHYIFMEYHNINRKRTYSVISSIIQDNFRIINKRANILTLENMKLRKA